jgi:hypothetical protein
MMADCSILDDLLSSTQIVKYSSINTHLPHNAVTTLQEHVVHVVRLDREGSIIGKAGIHI